MSPQPCSRGDSDGFTDLTPVLHKVPWLRWEPQGGDSNPGPSRHHRQGGSSCPAKAGGSRLPSEAPGLPPPTIVCWVFPGGRAKALGQVSPCPLPPGEQGTQRCLRGPLGGLTLNSAPS